MTLVREPKANGAVAKLSGLWNYFWVRHLGLTQMAFFEIALIVLGLNQGFLIPYVDLTSPTVTFVCGRLLNICYWGKDGNKAILLISLFFLTIVIQIRCELIFPCSFDLHLPIDKRCWGSVHISVGHLHVIFGEISLSKSFANFFTTVCLDYFLSSSRSSLCVWDINTVLAMQSESNFSHSLGCLLTLLIVSFDL